MPTMAAIAWAAVFATAVVPFSCVLYVIIASM